MGKKRKRKGQTALWNVLVAGVVFVALGITLSIGSDVTQTVRDGMTTGSAAWAAANNATNGIGNLAKWQPTMGTVIAAGAIISILLSSFVAWAIGRQQQGGGV